MHLSIIRIIKIVFTFPTDVNDHNIQNVNIFVIIFGKSKSKTYTVIGS